MDKTGSRTNASSPCSALLPPVSRLWTLPTPQPGHPWTALTGDSEENHWKFHSYKLFLHELVLMCLLPSSWTCLKFYKHLDAYENEIIQMSLQMLRMASQYSINAKKISSPHMGVSVCKCDQENNDQMHTHSWWRWLFPIPVVRMSIF